MPTFTTTAKYALRWLTGTNVGSDIDAGFQALAEDLDSKIVVYGQGVLASRPVSTSGSPGKQGRRYWATDVKTEYYDTGTSWEPVNTAPSVTLLASTADSSTLGSGYQGVAGLSAIVAMRKGQVALLDAAIMLVAADGNDGTMAFWAVGGVGGAMLTGAGRAPGTQLSSGSHSDHLQVPVGGFYVAPADGNYTFLVYATNEQGGGQVRGVSGQSWARIVVH